ncbi:MAG: hypothetical protein HYW48_02420 [Deltaproteobacteria bacterium]|nr:hypothetical protein [Deltaproteobacteria bacterium]
MDLFDSHRDLLGTFPHDKDGIPRRECNAPPHFCQREIVLKVARRLVQNRSPQTDKKSIHLTQFDERLVEHMQKNRGWDHGSQLLWTRRGFEIQAAKKRVQSLKAGGFLDRNFSPTEKFASELQILKEKRKNHAERRFHYFREARDRETREFFQRSSTPLYSLTKRNGRSFSGKDLARVGVGIEKPVTGIQRDHSKILHDVSVIDAVRHAQTRFVKRGYQTVAVLSEHQMYQTKTSPNSDTNHRYADAYLIMKSPRGDEETVAVEFGNYAPSYMKEKMQGIDADHRVIYTHDSNRAEEYQNVLEDIPGPPVEVCVIPTLHMEVER